jgi:molecular chaperone DnaJ
MMDLYIVLGIERHATPADIKRAYRRLARRYHPDINPGDGEAARRFHQILEAYETLIDPDLRRRYDAGQLAAPAAGGASFGFTGFDFSAHAHAERATTFGDLFEEVFARRASREEVNSPQAGADLHRRVTLTFEEAWHGTTHVETVTRHEVCGSCEGGGVHRTFESPCMACEGSGVVRTVRGHMVFAKTCVACQGAGRLRLQTCETCHGQGVEAQSEIVRVRVPPGVDTGARVRVAGKGHAGARGGPPGDLYIDIDVAPHPFFVREGDDLHLTVPVAIDEAALGARIDVPTPDGPARVRVPPGTQSGQRFRLRERGVPSPRGGPRGDLVVEVRLMLPKLLDERSKALLREFGRLNGESVRADAFGTG